jgi:hypothetical protein
MPRLLPSGEADVERAPVPGWETVRQELAGPILVRAGAAFEAAAAHGQTLSLDEAVEAAFSFDVDRLP